MAKEFRVHHVGVIARNYDEMVRWYERHLGFTLDREWTMPETHPGVRMCLLKRGDFFVELIAGGTRIGHQVAADPGEDYRITGFRHIAFEVDDVDGMVAKLVSEGVPVFFAPMTFDVISVRAALIRDPEGNTIELMKWV